MDKNDLLTPGAISGIIGALLQDSFGSILKSLHVTDRIFVDFAKILVLSHTTHGLLSFIIGWVAHLTIGAVFGVIYSYMIKFSTKNYFLFKGLGLGILSWGFLLSMGTFYKMPLFATIEPVPGIIMLIGSSIWGIITAITLKWFTKNFQYYIK